MSSNIFKAPPHSLRAELINLSCSNCQQLFTSISPANQHVKFCLNAGSSRLSIYDSVLSENKVILRYPGGHSKCPLCQHVIYFSNPTHRRANGILAQAMTRKPYRAGPIGWPCCGALCSIVISIKTTQLRPTASLQPPTFIDDIPQVSSTYCINNTISTIVVISPSISLGQISVVRVRSACYGGSASVCFSARARASACVGMQVILIVHRSTPTAFAVATSGLVLVSRAIPHSFTNTDKRLVWL